MSFLKPKAGINVSQGNYRTPEALRFRISAWLRSIRTPTEVSTQSSNIPHNGNQGLSLVYSNASTAPNASFTPMAMLTEMKLKRPANALCFAFHNVFTKFDKTQIGEGKPFNSATAGTMSLHCENRRSFSLVHWFILPAQCWLHLLKERPPWKHASNYCHPPSLIVSRRSYYRSHSSNRPGWNTDISRPCIVINQHYPPIRLIGQARTWNYILERSTATPQKVMTRLRKVLKRKVRHKNILVSHNVKYVANGCWWKYVVQW